ncbi:MAG: isoamylase early set domain-containing protein [Verrucomicrobiota bacterium]
MATSNSAKMKAAFSLLAPAAKDVMVAGDFTGWELSPKTMKKNKSGEWKLVLSLAPGRYEYRFLVDGQWCDDPQCIERAPNPFGGDNCVRIIA